jgi:hypothetical protein
MEIEPAPMPDFKPISEATVIKRVIFTKGCSQRDTKDPYPSPQNDSPKEELD